MPSLTAAETGLFQSRFVVPSFVVDELQQAADSPDKQRRLRGRRGLDVLGALRENKTVDIEVLAPADETDADSSEEQRVVAMARQLGGRIITNDPNVVKIAGVRSVQALNINDIALSLKPTFVAGDMVDVRLPRRRHDGRGGGGPRPDRPARACECHEHAPDVGRPARVRQARVLPQLTGRCVSHTTR